VQSEPCPRSYHTLTANDFVVLSLILRQGDRHTDPHVSLTTQGIASSLGISVRHAHRILARLQGDSYIERSKDKVRVTGTYRTRRRAPRHVYRITTAGLELIDRYKADLRW